ncbi:MAG: hypothetical protein JNN30_07980 [Rhodanobacteraceae bacterium]|nr:hypothetical protein [Rhodanobacteraceae bacterium]
MAEPELSLQALRLATLPEFDPPARLWERIEAVHQQRRRRQRLAQWGMGVAAVLALATVLLVPRHDLASSDSRALAQLENRSRELEQTYADLSQTASAADSEVELRAVEFALQQAYDRGATLNELLPLWQQRNEVLVSLIAQAADGAQLTRI